MVYAISALGSRWEKDEDELEPLTPDNVFDILEDIEDDLLNEQKTLAFTIAKGLDRDAQYQYNRIKRALTSLNDLWNTIRDSTIDTFYLNSIRKSKIVENEDAVSAYHELRDALFYKGNVIIRERSIELSVENGAQLKTEEHLDENVNYICFALTNGANEYVYDAYRYGVDTMMMEIKTLNMKNRFFKCKECGKIAYVPKSDDVWKIANNLQPVKRCSDCIKRRKTEKAIQQHVDTKAVS